MLFPSACFSLDWIVAFAVVVGPASTAFLAAVLDFSGVALGESLSLDILGASIFESVFPYGSSVGSAVLTLCCISPLFDFRFGGLVMCDGQIVVTLGFSP